MARNRGGGFGSGGFASGGGPQNRNQPTTTAPVRGAAARPNKIGRRDNKRSGVQGRRQSQQDRVGNPTTPFDDAPLDTAAGSIAFNNDDNLELGAWGVLNNAGISRDPGGNPFGQNATPWLEGRVSAWADQHRGNLLVNDPNATFENALSQHAGVPGTVPGAGADPGDPLGFRPWLSTERGMGQNQIQNLGQNRRRRLRNRHGDYVDAFGEDSGAGESIDSNAAPMTPAEQAMMLQTLGRDWEGATARTRGYRSGDWVGSKRTIQF